MSNYDVVIVGGGPAGLAAGLYTARLNLKTLLLDRGPLGGQLLNTELVEDYPGFESILGTELATKMGDHARRFGLEVREFEPVKEIDKDASAKIVRMESGDEFRAPALIMAAGGLPGYLGGTGEKGDWGAAGWLLGGLRRRILQRRGAGRGRWRRRGCGGGRVPHALRQQGLYPSPPEPAAGTTDPHRSRGGEPEDRVHLRRRRQGDRRQRQGAVVENHEAGAH